MCVFSKGIYTGTCITITMQKLSTLRHASEYIIIKMPAQFNQVYNESVSNYSDREEKSVLQPREKLGDVDEQISK